MHKKWISAILSITMLLGSFGTAFAIDDNVAEDSSSTQDISSEYTIANDDVQLFSTDSGSEYSSDIINSDEILSTEDNEKSGYEIVERNSELNLFSTTFAETQSGGLVGSNDILSDYSIMSVDESDSGLTLFAASGDLGNGNIPNTNLEWRVTSSGELIISGDGNIPNYNTNTIDKPWSQHYNEILEITIEEGVTGIGQAAFYNLQKVESKVTIPASCKFIYHYAFEGSSIPEVYFEDGCETIWVYAFYNCQQLTSVKLPSTLRTIYETAFGGCSKLESINLNEGLQEIKRYWDNGSGEILAGTAVKSIKIPSTLTYMNGGAFRGIDGLTEVTVASGGNYWVDSSKLVIYSKDTKTLVSYLRTTENESFVVPSGTTKIGDGAFSYTSTLSKVTLPSSVTEIEYMAFSRASIEKCPNLQYVRTLGRYAFDNCTKMKSSSTDGKAIEFCSNLQTIPYRAFCGCIELEGKLILPNGITSIGREAFYGCVKLQSNESDKFTIPDTCTSIGENAFTGCTGLKGQLVLPDNLTSLGSSPFGGCSGLTGELKIPSGLESISSYSFEHISQNSNHYYYYTQAPFYGTNISSFDTSEAQWFGTDNRKAILFKLDDNGKKTELVQCAPGSTSLDESYTLTLDNTVTMIYAYAFYNCTNAKCSINFEYAPITQISCRAFTGCTNLKSKAGGGNGLTFRSTLKAVQYEAFKDCTSLTGRLEFVSDNYGSSSPDWNYSTSGYNSSQLDYINSYAFLGCSGLMGALSIPDSTLFIGTQAFYKCSGLQELEIGTGLDYIGSEVFRECTSIESPLTLPQNLTYIGDRAFYGDSKISGTLSIPSSIKTIGNAAFQNCSGLEKLEINTGITTLGTSAFQDCYGLVGELSIPTTLTTISTSAFQGCRGLTSLVFQGNTKYIYDSAFRDCENLTGSIKVPSTIQQINTYAFYNLPNVTDLYINREEGAVGTGGYTDGTDHRVHWAYDLSKAIIEVEGSAEGKAEYNGGSFEPTVKSPTSGKVLYKGTDYIVVVDGAATVNSGVKVTIQPPGGGVSYNSQTKNYTIEKASLTTANITVVDDNFVYTGKQFQPKIVVEKFGKALSEAIDYEITYGDNVDAGSNTISITITAKNSGNYKEQQTVYRDIQKRDVAGALFLDIAGANYTGDEVEPTFRVNVNDTYLGTNDFDIIDYYDNVNAGTQAYVKIQGKGNYTGTAQTYFTIEQQSIAESVTAEFVNSDNPMYTGDEISPEVKLTYNNRELVKNTDYTLEYHNNVSPGNNTYVTITGIGNFKGSTQLSFTIDKVQFNDGDYIKIKPGENRVYNGKNQTPDVTLTYENSGKTINLVEGTDYKFTIDENHRDATEAGQSILVTINAKGSNYTGSRTTKFKIDPKAVGKYEDGTKDTYADDIKIVIGDVVYNGKEQTGGLKLNDSAIDSIEAIE